MTQRDILRIAMEQSAIDCGCDPSDFEKTEHVVVRSVPHPEARRYLTLPFSCNLVSYGNNVVASVSEEYRVPAEAYIAKYPVEHCFETPNLHVLNDALLPMGQKICFMAEYFLSDTDNLRERPCPYEMRILYPEDFADLYVPEWSNALCEHRKHLDVLGVGAYDSGKLVGLAAVRRTAKPCGRSASMFCRPIVVGGLRPRLQAVWHSRFSNAEKFPSTAPRGQTSAPCGTQ